jgi:pimeloyl-ACP methyl ester carboxylesterase
MSKPHPPRSEQVVTLADGRRLGGAEFGDPDGAAILWFHATPGARRQIPPRARQLGSERGLRIVAVERPGIGWSTPHLYESVLGWAHDVEEVADQLGLDAFGLVGLSGGGPYVLACAHHMPARVVAAAVFGGVAPTRGVDAAAGGLLRLACPFNSLLSSVSGPLGALLSMGIRALHPISDQVFDLYLRVGPERDRELLSRPEMRAVFVDDLLTGSREGLRSVLYDVVLFSRPWGFGLRDLQVPVHFWQGDSDVIVPFSHGAHQAALVPEAGLTLRPGEGHLGGLDAAEEAIEYILSHWAERAPVRAPRRRPARRRTRSRA